MQYIKYYPWGRPHPPEKGNWVNISKTIEIPTPKPYNYILVPCVTDNIFNTLDMATGVNPTPRNGKSAEYLKNR
jgi:hypothetical protein